VKHPDWPPRRAVPVLGLIVFLAVPANSPAGQGTAGLASGEVLLLISSARSDALFAPVAGGGGLSGLSSNPASLAGQDYRSISGSYSQMPGGTRLGQVSAASPAGPAVCALNVGSFNAGEVSLMDDAGMAKTVQTQNDIVGGVSIAMPVGGGASAGLTFNWYQSTLVEKYRASTQAVDAGVRWETAGGQAALAAAVRNIGGRLDYFASPMSLPVLYALGGSWRAWKGQPGSVSLLAEGNRRAGSGIQYAFGVEAAVYGVLVLRGGARVDNGLAAAGGGAGLRIRSIGLDYSRVAQAGLPASSRVSMETRF